MKLIKRIAVYRKTLILLTGFFVLIVGSFENVLAQFPSASFTSNNFTGCAPLSVDFTNLSSQATDYQWDFGNGNTSTLQDPTTVYLTPGFYTVTLIALNNVSGNTDTLVAVNYINVLNNPVADFSLPSFTGCAFQSAFSFTNLSQYSNSFTWDFGDGNFSTDVSPTHVYNSPGVYAVTLIAANPYGCNDIVIKNAYVTIFPNPPASFTVNQQSSCDASQVFNFTCTTPGSVGWSWSFGDGATSNLENPSHVYSAPGSYTVSLIVLNGNGCTDTTTHLAYITIGPSLVPSFSVNSQGGCIPFDVQFDCTVPGAITWLWDFGDGATSTTEDPSHTYTAAGSYDITLTVTTSSGCNGTVSLPGYITVDPLPVPGFVVNDPGGCAPHTTSITNTTAFGATYTWDFGNGSTSTDVNPTAVYPDSGTYSITLTAVSPNGCQSSATQTAVVSVETITALMTATPRNGCAPLTVNFTGSSTPPGVTWSWNFGDGANGTGQNISHTYNAIGNYDITLVVTSALGCTDTLFRNNYVKVVDDSTNYTLPDTMLVCTPPGSIAFTDPTTGSNSWLWNFGDGTTATVKNPSHVYTTPGVYTVTLNTGMAGGCMQSFNPFAIVNVIPFITTPILAVVATPCSPFSVQLDNLSPAIATYHWEFGDGDTSDIQNPVHVYAQPGVYTISLQLTNTDGCQTTLDTTISFGHLNVITVSDTTNCLGDPITFGLNPPGAFVAASWDFGNGATSNLMQPVYTFPDTGIYYVSATVTDTSGCIYTYTYQNAIYTSDPHADFTINQPGAGCAPYDVQFINNSTNASSYYWNFGDGTNGSATNPLHTYTTPGVYTVVLNANRRGCRNTMTLTNLITVYEATAAFTFTPDSGCIPMPVSFTDQSIDAVSWLWDFGDGTSDTTANPVHTYNILPGSTVSLIITDIHGCSDTATAPNLVGIYPDITVSDSYACLFSAVNFTTTLNASSYLWDFGDGSTSIQQNPVHSYTVSGTYTVSLTCVMPSGCTTTAIYPTNIIVDAPVANFMSPTLTVCAPSLVNFTNLSTGSTSWIWNFGDGSMPVAAENAGHIYNTPGIYTISLVAISDSGCSDTLTMVDYIAVPGTITNFSISAMDACQNSQIQFTDLSVNAAYWFWNFGDGFTDTIQNPLHLYADTGSYTVTLITYDSSGCTSFYSYPGPVSIHANPVGDATVSPGSGCIPHDVTFTSLSSGASTYTWNFDDGTSATAGDTVHTYTATGIFYPSLIVSTSFGCADTFIYQQGITVSSAPVAAFAMNLPGSCAPATVTFVNNSTGLLNPVYQWDFGNGQTSTLENPVIVYSGPGSYPIILIVSNGGGCADTLLQQLVISSPITAAATAIATEGCAPFPVTFNNNSANATTWFWNFGDGNTSSLISPTHTYTSPGTYNVTLIASDGGGCADTLVLPVPVQVGQSPVANFSRTPATGCSPVTVQFNNTSSQVNNPTYSWDFGNGQTSNQTGAVITYTAANLYTVSLIVTNSNGCSDTVAKNVNVFATPVASGSISSYNGCAPHSVNFTNNSQQATSYVWYFGDGSFSSQASPSHVYTTPGIYTVMLIANGTNGCADTMIAGTPVTVAGTPNAIINASVSSGCAPLGVSFTSNSTGLVNASYAWNFGNGQTSILKDDSSYYNLSGTYPVSLVVTNTGGCADSASTQIAVTTTPQASAVITDTLGCAPYTVTFTNTSVNATGYSWNFGDGNTSSLASPVHTYTTPGDYTITLTATTSGGCSSQVLLPATVHVKAMPAASFTSSASYRMRTPAGNL